MWICHLSPCFPISPEQRPCVEVFGLAYHGSLIWLPTRVPSLLSCCIRLSWLHGKNWSMCPYIWTYLNPPMKPCLVALKRHLILARFALGWILRQWFDDNSKALLLSHERTAAHCPIPKNSATALARRWRQHSPSISALNKLADGDFPRRFLSFASLSFCRILSSPHQTDQLPAFYLKTHPSSTQGCYFASLRLPT